MTGGTAEVTEDYGSVIDIYGGTFTLGTNDSSVSTTSPFIKGINVGIGRAYGTFNFYDGKIEARADRSITQVTGTSPVNTPTGYEVTKTTSGTIETAILSPAHTHTLVETNQGVCNAYKWWKCQYCDYREQRSFYGHIDPTVSSPRCYYYCSACGSRWHIPVETLINGRRECAICQQPL